MFHNYLQMKCLDYMCKYNHSCSLVYIFHSFGKESLRKDLLKNILHILFDCFLSLSLFTQIKWCCCCCRGFSGGFCSWFSSWFSSRFCGGFCGGTFFEEIIRYYLLKERELLILKPEWIIKLLQIRNRNLKLKTFIFVINS